MQLIAARWSWVLIPELFRVGVHTGDLCLTTSPRQCSSVKQVKRAGLAEGKQVARHCRYCALQVYRCVAMKSVSQSRPYICCKALDIRQRLSTENVPSQSCYHMTLIARARQRSMTLAWLQAA